MALSPNMVKTIIDSIKAGATITFKYYPNQKRAIDKAAGFRTLKGDRIVLPIRLFSRGGKYYMLAYYISGASLSGGKIGYRLYFQKNMYGVKGFFNPYNFSKVKKIKMKANNELTKLIISKKED